MLELDKKIKRLSGIDFLSKVELRSIFLQTIIFILLFMPFIQESFNSDIMFMVFLFLSLVQIVVFPIRRTKYNYIQNYKIYLVLVLSHLLLFSGVVSFLYRTKSFTLFTEIIAAGWLILFFSIGLINFKISAKYLFYWRLKKTFPYEGDEIDEVEVSLKKLSPYISLEKQKAYVIIKSGMTIIIYGFYIYLCLFIFRMADFNSIPVLEKIQTHFNNWNFINISNTIGLFSIFLALLTICVPVQQRIIREAEKEMLEKYKI